MPSEINRETSHFLK